MGVSVPGPGLRGRGMGVRSAGEEASALEHASACEWAAWRDIDVHVHQHAHRYLATSLHGRKQHGPQCTVEVAGTVWNAGPGEGLGRRRRSSLRKPGDQRRELALILAGRGWVRATRFPWSSDSAADPGQGGLTRKHPRAAPRRRSSNTIRSRTSHLPDVPSHCTQIT